VIRCGGSPHAWVRLGGRGEAVVEVGSVVVVVVVAVVFGGMEERNGRRGQ